MSTVGQTMSEETGTVAEIRKLVGEWANAMAAKDIDSILQHYADDVVAFDVPPPLQINGKEAVRGFIQHWLKMFEGPVDVEFRDMNIIAGTDVAVLHTLSRVSDRNRGPESGNWVRVTVCYQKRDGKWVVTHEHASLPFMGGQDDPATRLQPSK